jgi:hypothetical protein
MGKEIVTLVKNGDDDDENGGSARASILIVKSAIRIPHA